MDIPIKLESNSISTRAKRRSQNPHSGISCRKSPISFFNRRKIPQKMTSETSIPSHSPALRKAREPPRGAFMFVGSTPLRSLRFAKVHFRGVLPPPRCEAPFRIRRRHLQNPRHTWRKCFAVPDLQARSPQPASHLEKMFRRRQAKLKHKPGASRVTTGALQGESAQNWCERSSNGDLRIQFERRIAENNPEKPRSGENRSPFEPGIAHLHHPTSSDPQILHLKNHFCVVFAPPRRGEVQIWKDAETGRKNNALNPRRAPDT